MLTLGLDYGTESGRVMLVDASSGAELAWRVVPYPHGVMERSLPDGTPLAPDWALQHPADYLHVLEEAVPAVLAEANVTAEQIVGIGVDFTASTPLPTRTDGTPLCTLPEFSGNPHAWVKLWKHHAAEPQAKRINAVAAERDDHLGNARVDAVIFGREIGQRGLRDVVVAGNECDAVESRSSVRHLCRL